MSMFSFPADMNEMMKPMQSMTDWTKLDEMPVSPLMVYPLGAAAAATAIGLGMAGQMAGMMMGAMQAAMQNQSSLLGNHPDLSLRPKRMRPRRWMRRRRRRRPPMWLP